MNLLPNLVQCQVVHACAALAVLMLAARGVAVGFTPGRAPGLDASRISVATGGVRGDTDRRGRPRPQRAPVGRRGEAP